MRQHQPGLCMGAAAAVPLTSFKGNLLQQLSGNYVFVVGFWAWFAAQFMKVSRRCYNLNIRAIRCIKLL